ncbi:MAG: hypothetical protein HWN66_09610 [Candidatus Helarchaeota archaeon]|nr:hypothetical protein [Candidatus Helarchaeota archaeon]
MIVNTGVFPQIAEALYFTWDVEPLIEGILPLYISPSFQIVVTYIMFAGGALGVISGCLGRD